MDLHDVVATYGRVKSDPSRRAKIEAVGALLARSPHRDLATIVHYLSGDLPQGKIGLGFATVGAVQAAPADDATLTVADVDDVLDRIKATSGSGSKKAKEDLLAELLSRANADEQDFLRRLLVGSLRQGALEGVMADAVALAGDVPAPLVRRAAMLSGDLPGVATRALEEGPDALSQYGLHVFTPVQPMLAKSAPSVEDALRTVSQASPGSPVAVEWKVDGARVQVHRSGDDVRVYTRSLRDISAGAGAIASVVAELDVDSVILDGEAVGWFPDGQADFQETMRSFSSDTPTNDHGAAALRVMFFDCLHLDGTDLIDAAADERRRHMEAALPEHLLIPRIETGDPTLARAHFDHAIASGFEGVMVKSLDGSYEAGRRGAGWFKVKPVYNLDLVVLAVEWGSGRRRGKLSNIHLGARQPDTSDEFVMLGKTFKGMTDAMLDWQTERFLELEVGRDGRVVRVRPEQVVEIAVDGIQRSTRYPGGVALRFARVKRYRTDKAAAEADTLDTVRELGRA